MCLHEQGKTEYRRIHELHNEVMYKVYFKICNNFRHVFLLEECMKILKRLDVTQLKLVLAGDLPKPTRFMFDDFRGISFQSVPLIVPKATVKQRRRYFNNFTLFE